MPNYFMKQPDEDMKVDIFIIAFAVILFAAAFLFNTPTEIWNGNLVILTSPANLVTDYFKIANVGAALVNASLMVFKAIIMIKLCKLKFTGLMVAAVFTVAGFSLFGKNLYNSIPIILGVLAYCRFTGSSFGQQMAVALFGTSLGPLVSEVTFNSGLPFYIGVPLGILAGLAVGFSMPVLSRHFYSFHKGFSLYNIGFTSGIIGTFFIAVFRSFGSDVSSVYFVSKGNNLYMAVFLYILFTAILIIGLKSNHWSFKGYSVFKEETGRMGEDLIKKYGYGLVFMNMALLGFLTTSYILLVGGELNGPTIGGVLTVVGFAASGKHLKNVVPVLSGIFLVGFLSVHDVSSTAALLAALFGTTLAPVCGFYGPIAGVIAGGLHIVLTTNISVLHAGMNLYNNGFSGGFVAALVVPILDKIYEKTERNSKNIIE